VRTTKAQQMKHWNFIDPLNLWNYPFMNTERKPNHAADRRANSLKLRPTKRQTSNFNKRHIEPPLDDIDFVTRDRVAMCLQFNRRK
jgi:hypothetical protein